MSILSLIENINLPEGTMQALKLPIPTKTEMNTDLKANRIKTYFTK